MAMEFLPAEAREALPWKNGGGLTREVAAQRAEGGGSADFDWRISMADVAADGPFSSFEGYDRIITLLRGPGMVLTVDGAEHRIDVPFQPFAFAGGSTTDCRLLGGPLLDFNVMARSGRVTASVEVLRLADGSRVPVAVGWSETLVVVVFEGRASVDGAELGPLDAVALPPESTATITAGGSGTAAVVGLVGLRA